MAIDFDEDLRDPKAFGPSFAKLRRRMVKDQLRSREITDLRVLEAMGRVPREEFVPPDLRPSAYEDRPLPIGHGQTISQPYIVALMTQLGQPRKGARALDVGTGSGYQAAVLAELVHRVYSIEILCPLADAARQRLEITRLQQRRGPLRRWFPWLVRARAVRCHYCGRRGRQVFHSR